MGAAALVRCADDDMILSNDHVLARTLDQEAKKLLHQSFVGTLNGTMAVTYAIGEVLPQPPPFVAEKRRETFGADAPVLCFLRAACALPAMGLDGEPMYCAVDLCGGALRCFLLSPTKPELGVVVLYLDEATMTLAGGDETYEPGQPPAIVAVLESRCPRVAEPVVAEPALAAAVAVAGGAPALRGSTRRARASAAPAPARAAADRGRGRAAARGRRVTVCPVSGGGCPRDYQKEIVAYRAAVRFEALFSADVAKKRGRRYSLAPCAPDPEGDDPAGGLLLLAHDRRECIRATVDAAGIVAAGRFELARVAA
ncbi:protein-histidine N-methyltransferase [Aureococcus anophagefferens]|uniref:Protein-histidine N-methyltransferase n=1 Tax=Aureococcus anophagefferens TaxID=44056 RepID=A0ABR1GAN3_AURAN